MKIYVLDASVVLTFLLGENEMTKGKVTTLLRRVSKKKIKLYSSFLLPLEVGNGLRYTLKDQELADEVLKIFLALPIEYFAFRQTHCQKILQLSYTLRTSFYDTSYHFLAKLLKGTFVTCDAEYFKKAERLGNIKFF